MKALRRGTFKQVPGKNYGTPKEIWGFRAPRGRGNPKRIALEFLRANEDLLGIAKLARRLRHQRTIEGLGARHVIFQQWHLKMRIHRAYVTVHLDRRGRVYLVKNRAMPRNLLPKQTPFRIAKADARRRALRSIRASASQGHVTEPEPLWYPVRTLLHPAYKIRIHRNKPRSEWIIYVDGEKGDILSKYDNLALVRGTATVFDPNPVVGAPTWEPLEKSGRKRRRPGEPPPDAYRTVTLRHLKGNGYLEGRHVSTALMTRRLRRPDHRFETTSTRPGFEEVMAYFHIDEAVRYLETLGYRGPCAIFKKPVPVNARGTRDDNSWYSPGRKSLTFGTGDVDDAEDAEIILHELGHAIQDAICPDFGQSPEAAAMGEGFGDYFAASFFAAKKPPAFRATVGSWDGVTLESDREGEPPCIRRVDEPVTYESFDHSRGADEHENGRIWSATLWEIWQALDRDVADRIVIESHFQLDGFTTFARGARAILDADRNLYRGRHRATLSQIFHQRGIGPVE